MVGSNGALAGFVPLAAGHLLASFRACWLQFAVVLAAVGLHVAVSIMQACLPCLFLIYMDAVSSAASSTCAAYISTSRQVPAWLHAHFSSFRCRLRA